MIVFGVCYFHTFRGELYQPIPILVMPNFGAGLSLSNGTELPEDSLSYYLKW